jgi:hypothetical protein
MGERPNYNAFAVEGEGDNVQWTRIGAAWKTRGDGINVILRALPVNGRVVLRIPKDDDEPEPPQQNQTNNRGTQRR